MTLTPLDSLNDCLAKLCEGQTLPTDEWPDEYRLALFNLRETTSGLQFLHPPDLLNVDAIRKQLPHLQIDIFTAVDSTNSYLMNLAANRASRLCSAEIQLGGRGRRGRQWTSPFARNLAISIGFSSQHPLSELGGLSLVCGLALVDVLEALGIEGAGLKWPNDVLIDGAKVCGILVELVTVAGKTEVIVGFGVNVDLQDDEVATIDQPVTDLRRQGITLSRTELLVRFTRSVEQHIAHFESFGFSPFVSAFNAVHVYHDKMCNLVNGDNVVTGRVLGVEHSGGLVVGIDDDIQIFHGGEVSLRKSG